MRHDLVAAGAGRGVVVLMLMGLFLITGAVVGFFGLLEDKRNPLPRSVLATGLAGGLGLLAYGGHALTGKKGRATLLKIGDRA